jgi:hypothetical protein
MKGQVVLGFTERAEGIPYESGKVVENWARTFECRPERFYVPNSEEQVVDVLHMPYCVLSVTNKADREFSATTGENDSGGWCGPFAVGYPMFVGMDDVT